LLKKPSKLDNYVIKKVGERRKALGLSQADLSFELNVSIGFIGQVESPNYPAHYNLRHLNEIASILKCSLYDLLPSRRGGGGAVDSGKALQGGPM
jgi:transcriptional regulator with XRE-family HTH domain